MKFSFVALVVGLALSSSAALASCPSVDAIIAGAKVGVRSSVEYGWFPGSAIASVMQCQVKEMQGMCEIKKGLAKELVQAAHLAFSIGETDRTVIKKLEDELKDLEVNCK